ncbi:MAG: Rrf2 family transcriptional regulator [Dehalococcoidia bacterium]
MRLSTRSRYAIRALLDLAIHAEQGPVLVREIAEREDISVRYLEQLLLPLKAANLVRATRGANGGFMLAKPPSEINLREVIQITEGTTAFTECADDASICPRSDTCLLIDVWNEVTEAANKVLEATSLENLKQRHKARTSHVVV